MVDNTTMGGMYLFGILSNEQQVAKTNSGADADEKLLIEPSAKCVLCNMALILLLAYNTNIGVHLLK